LEAQARNGARANMSAAAWLEDLQALAARFGAHGIGPDLAALTLAEAWGLYRFLSRVAGGGDAG
jgi:hypothetical protein